MAGPGGGGACNTRPGRWIQPPTDPQSRSGTGLRPRPTRRTIVKASTRRWPRDSHNTVSGIPGAVHYSTWCAKNMPTPGPPCDCSPGIYGATCARVVTGGRSATNGKTPPFDNRSSRTHSTRTATAALEGAAHVRDRSRTSLPRASTRMGERRCVVPEAGSRCRLLAVQAILRLSIRQEAARAIASHQRDRQTLSCGVAGQPSHLYLGGC